MPRPRKPKPLLTFVVDTREQAPWTFAAPVRSEFADGGTIVEGLAEGDYSALLEGEYLPVRIERKSLGDLFGCAGYGRERFERELQRLQAFPYRAVVIEASVNNVLRGYERSRIPGRTVVASLCCWSVQYLIPIWFGETRRRSAGITQRLLEEAAIHAWRKRRADGSS